MLNKKFLLGAILTAAVCLTACSKDGNEVSETVSETISETANAAAETASDTSETTVETTTAMAETEEKAVSSIADNIKEALKSVWNDDIYFVQIYAEDLNNDGVKELLVNCSFRSSDDRGTTYVFDVSDGADKLYEISANTAAGDMYADENGNLHYIIRESFYNYIKANDYFTSMNQNYIYFDISHDSIKMPFYGDRSAGDEQVRVYKNCEVMPTSERTHTNFRKNKAEFVGKVNEDELNAAWRDNESNEASQIIQEAVFDGLTYVSEPSGIYFGSNFENFEELWQDAELRIGQAYGYEKIPDTSGVDYIKEALQAEWDNSEYNISVVNLYAEDLNGDGVKELFANYSFSAAQMGITYVYDVSDGMKKLYEISARMWSEKSELYKDESGTLHLIRKEGYAGGTYQMDNAYFDITYDSIKMPIYAKVYDWYDGGAHLFDFDIYKNCEVAPLDFQDSLAGWRNFDPEKAEYIGRYDWDDVWNVFEKQEENEIGEIIQKEVYEGLTYISDIEELYSDSGYSSGYGVAWNFEYFWQEAAPKLAEAYGGAASAKSVDTSGVEYMKEALQADWNDPFGIELYAADLNGDGVKELLKTDYFAAGWYGLTYVYDVSDGAKKLFTAGVRIWQDGDSEIYSDENGNIHLIAKEYYPGCSHYSDTAYFDITYDSVKMPLFTRIVKGENEYENSIYTDCEVIPSFYDEEHSNWRNFDPKSCKYAEKYDGTEYTDENGKMEELIKNTVYDGLTFVSEIEEFYKGSIQDFENFEEFWQEAAPKLAEEYNK